MCGIDEITTTLLDVHRVLCTLHQQGKNMLVAWCRVDRTTETESFTGLKSCLTLYELRRNLKLHCHGVTISVRVLHAITVADDCSCI